MRSKSWDRAKGKAYNILTSSLKPKKAFSSEGQNWVDHCRTFPVSFFSAQVRHTKTQKKKKRARLVRSGRPSSTSQNKK